MPVGLGGTVRTLLPTGYTGLLVLTSALSCGLDGHEISALNDLHSGVLPVEMVLLTPQRRNNALADEVASNMVLAMPYQPLAMSEFSEDYLRELPVTVLLRSGQVKMVHAGSVSRALPLVHAIINTR